MNPVAAYPLHEFTTASDSTGLLKIEQTHLNGGGELSCLQIRKKYSCVSHFNENKITGLSQENEDMVLMAEKLTLL